MMEKKQRLKNMEIPSYVELIILAVACFLCYGLLIPKLGFYWDDWPFLWIIHKLGYENFQKYLFDSILYANVVKISSSILGTNPSTWQIFGCLSRFISSVGFWWLIRLTWPMKKNLAFWGSLLFLVFPGFFMQFIPINFGHFFIFVNFFLLSLCMNLLALKHKKMFWLFTPVALGLSFMNLAGWENYFVLELLRPFFIWFFLNNKNSSKKNKWKQLILAWIPFLILFLSIAAWRAFFFPAQTARYQFNLIELIKVNPMEGFREFIVSLFTSIWLAFIGGWAKVDQISNIIKMRGEIKLIYTTLINGVLFLLLLYSFLTKQFKQKFLENEKCNLALQLSIVGVIGLLIAGTPYLLTSLPLTLTFPNNRFIVSFIPGSVFLLLGITYLIASIKPWLRNFPPIFLSLLVAFSVGTQYKYAIDFSRDWEYEKRLFWQISWRIPAVKPGTVILVNEFVGNYFTDNSITAPFNWIYAPDYRGGLLPYDIFSPTIRLGNALPGFKLGLPIEHVYRPVTFIGNTSQAVSMIWTPHNCLRILDSELDSVNETLPTLMKEAASISDPKNIIPGNFLELPKEIFGNEPIHDWCYYFEKADFARQQSDWIEIVTLGETAFNNYDPPNTAEERFPFIEGYAHTGDWIRAVELTSDSAGVTPLILPVLCTLWQRISAQTSSSPEKTTALAQVSDLLACTLP